MANTGGYESTPCVCKHPLSDHIPVSGAPAACRLCNCHQFRNAGIGGTPAPCNCEHSRELARKLRDAEAKLGAVAAVLGVRS